ncbi:hypothetical protein ABFX02_03G092100 [Erythranthe guttata]
MAAILIVIIISVALVIQPLVAAEELAECHNVHIGNFLPPASRETVVSCLVNDTDLGLTTIGPEKEYVYEFCGQRTISFCRIYWGMDKAIIAHVFDSFSGTCHGASCYYAMKPEGAYYSDSYPPKAFVKKYDWESTYSRCSTIGPKGWTTSFFLFAVLVVVLLY